MAFWSVEEFQGVAVLTFDTPGRRANVLSQSALLELDRVLAELARRPAEGLIIRSGKENSFVVGADVYEFQKIRDSARAAELARAGQMVFDHLAALPFPTVALIHGKALGGGLELALAASYRIATDDAGTRLGLPEIKLGIHPGFGGTVRLPRLVGDLAALDLMLKGRAVSAREARRIGLVDEVVPERHLLAGGAALLRRRPPRRISWWKRAPGWGPVRPQVARALKPSLARKAPLEHYPAPHRLLDLWARSGGLDDEAVSLGELLVTPASRHLVHLFLVGEELKRSARAEPHGVQHVHVIGAGVMGADIAIWAAHCGFTVTLQDRRPQAVAQAMRRAYVFLKKEVRTERAIQAVMDRIVPDMHAHAAGRADLVIEAIVEDEQAKRALFAELETRVPEHVLFASNTSSIPIERLAAGLRHPGRLFGLHFFNPVTKMPLIEVVRGGATDAATLARGRSFAGALDRFPLVVASTPGFLVNRALMPYLLEAVVILEEGIPAPVVDASAVAFGMPMGPVALADTVGLDVCLSVAEHLSATLETEVPRRLRALVAEGRLGKKTRHGFYRYDHSGRAIDAPAGRVAPEIGERLIWRLVNEAAACLREGVVQDADLVDAGLVFGTGFAPFRGGPLRYAEELGGAGVQQSLTRLTRDFGARFTPDDGWSRPDFFARRALAP
ncbi:MAG: 3-hydroxyacyl-CoA dehydrogenase NAD-binding domain-containing protein [Acidiferrobacteraceae bacterium]